MTHGSHSRATTSASITELVLGWDGRVGVQPIDSPPLRAPELPGRKRVLSLMLGIQVSTNPAAILLLSEPSAVLNTLAQHRFGASCFGRRAQFSPLLVHVPPNGCGMSWFGIGRGEETSSRWKPGGKIQEGLTKVCVWAEGWRFGWLRPGGISIRSCRRSIQLRLALCFCARSEH